MAAKTDGNSMTGRTEHKHRMRQDWHDLMEDLIQDGHDNGLFDNLPGKGKPLNLSKNHFAGEMVFANELMKEHDVPPVWIQDRNMILADTKALRDEIERQWPWHQREIEQVSIEEKGRVTVRWDDYCRKWMAQIEALNKQIAEFNLKRPLDNMELFKLDFETELARVNASRWLR